MPPRLAAPFICAMAMPGSLIHCSARAAVTQSNSAAYPNRVASPCAKRKFGAACAARASSSSPLSRSTPTTLPDAPTAATIPAVMAPVPHPTSNTDIRGRNRAPLASVIWLERVAVPIRGPIGRLGGYTHFTIQRPPGTPCRLTAPRCHRRQRRLAADLDSIRHPVRAPHWRTRFRHVQRPHAAFIVCPIMFVSTPGEAES